MIFDVFISNSGSSNPFLNSGGDFSSLQPEQPSTKVKKSWNQIAKVGIGKLYKFSPQTAGWNPFQDSGNFGSMPEDAIFGSSMFKGLTLLTEKFIIAGAEFDKMRNGAPTSNQPKRDPFGQNF